MRFHPSCLLFVPLGWAAACDSPQVLDLFPSSGSEGGTNGIPNAGGEPATPSGGVGGVGLGGGGTEEGGTNSGGEPSSAEAPLLRYSFDGEGTRVEDLVGGADGEVLGGAQLDGSGRLTVDGDDDFVDVPNGLISSLSSVTVMAWVRWSGGPCWHRVFDFGNTDEGEGNVGNALTTLFLTPEPCPEAGPLVTFRVGELGGGTAQSATLARPAEDQHYAVVVDGATMSLALYVDGQEVDRVAINVRLSQLVDENNWLGRSQWVQDLRFRGSYDEFRIYGRALDSAEIERVFALGPNRLD